MTQPTPAPDAAARDLMAEQAKEYGQYVATQDIYVGVALAYRQGDPVPASNVERHGYDKNQQVAKVGTKAAGAATGANSEGK
jgi:hypothetical protein